MEKFKLSALNSIDSISGDICALSDAIWEVPETAFRETESTRLQCEALEKLGFEVEKDLAGIPTAFSGRWGSGKPVIGVLGEFDALSGLSQQANIAVKDPIAAGGNGHGCGHNLLGAGSVAAAYAIKEYLKETGKSGTVIYYGCPGEEGGSGKAFMARDGIFDELDAALSWHPQDFNGAWYESTLANYQVNYKFSGVSSHAAAAPHKGRSALDAVELMNVGVQFLREHVTPDVRMHYAITNSGGFSPNVVQSKAEVLYLLRANETPAVQEIYERVNDIARGAALMTGTNVEIEFIKACSNIVVNNVVADVIHNNMVEIGCPKFTDEELKYAAEIRETLDKKTNPMEKIIPKLRPDKAEWVSAQSVEPIPEFIIPRVYTDSVMSGSSDVGDVSWVCPTGQVLAATWPTGVPAHSWQATAVGKSGFAKKAMLFAGKAMAGAAIDMIENPEIIEKAKAEQVKRIGDGPFVSPIPKDVKPAAIGMKN